MSCNSNISNQILNSIVYNMVQKETGELKYIQDTLEDFLNSTSDLVTGKYSSAFLDQYVQSMFDQYKVGLEEDLGVHLLKGELLVANQRLSVLQNEVDTLKSRLSALEGS